MSSVLPHVIVSHPARQANVYERPLAAERAGMDVVFLTGLYYVPERWPYSAVRWLPSSARQAVLERLEKRRIEGLPPERITSLLGPALETTLRPLRLIRTWNGAHDWLASRWIRRHAGSAPTILHCFQDASLRTLQAARDKGVLRLLEVTLPPEPAVGGQCREIVRLEAELAACDFALTQSDFSVRRLTTLGMPPERVLQVHLGVDTVVFRPREGPRPPGPFRALFVGNISRRKGVQYLLKAWRELNLPEAELILAGDNGSQEARGILAGGNGCFRSLGHVSESCLRGLFREADVLVQPSLAEGGCNAVYEALASGLPCIVTSNTSSAVRDGVEGFVIPPADVPSLKSAILSLRQSPGLRQRMALAARCRAESLSWEHFRRNLAAIYRSLAAAAEAAFRNKS